MCCLGYFISLERFLTQNSQKIAVMKKIAQKKTHKPNFFWKVLKNHINEIRNNEIRIRRGLPVLKENHSVFKYYNEWQFIKSTKNQSYEIKSPPWTIW
jgi:hypothetical protein